MIKFESIFFKNNTRCKNNIQKCSLSQQKVLKANFHISKNHCEKNKILF